MAIMYWIKRCFNDCFTCAGIKKRDKAMWASVSSLVLVIVSLLLEYKMVLDWVNKSDWSAMLDVVPTMFFLLCIYVVVMILVNVLIIFKSKK